MVTCASCGGENPDHARFCLECGAQLGAPRQLTDSRKMVTILFADVVGSTGLGEQLDPETLRALLARYFISARDILERHGGTVEKYIGDAFMAVFGIPLLHEDDALRAVRAAAELRQGFARINTEMEAERGLHIDFRIGVNSGEVVVSSAEGSLVTGDAVNVAARLEQAALPGEALIGRSTLDLVRDGVEVEVVKPIAAKGKSSAVEAFRLIDVLGAPRSVRAPRGGAFLGRARELRRLEEAFEDAQSERRCYLFSLLGSAGVGKSRLVAEFTKGVGRDALVVTGRCLPYGEGVTFWPIAEIVRGITGTEENAVADDARERIAETLEHAPDAAQIAELVENAVGLADEASRLDEVFWAIRRWLEGQARRRPLVCVVEDIHWAESTLLDLLEHVADFTRDAPILLLCTARPELLETRPNWGGGKVNATTVLLEPLSAEAAHELISGLVEESGLPAGLIERIHETAEGNPLFAEEIVQMLGDDRLPEGLAVRESLPMPTSVQAVISARLDRLPVGERVVAERASVAGRVFERGAVAALVSEDERGAVTERLHALMRKELVQPDQAEMSTGEAFRFRHMLIRDAAYEALAKTERAELHERFAGWIEEVTADRVVEYAEILGYHYEQAHRYRRELGVDDERSARLAARAGQLLADAARRARSRGDLPSALKLYRRATQLLGPSEELFAALLAEITVLHELQRYAEALDSTQRLEREAGAAGSVAYVWKARLVEITARSWSDPTFDLDSGEGTTLQALDVFEELGDQEGLGMAFKVRGDHYLARAQWALATADYERGIVHASVSDPILEDRLRSRLRNAAVWGSTRSTAVIELFEDHARRQPQVTHRVGFMASLALMHAMAGRQEEAATGVERALARWREVSGAENTDAFAAGFVPYVLGDLDRAATLFGQCIDVLERLGETGERSTLVAMLALVEVDRGNFEVARRLAGEARDLSQPDDAASQLSWRAAMALVESQAGDRDAAEVLIAKARELDAATDFVYLRGVVARSAGGIAELYGDGQGAIEWHQTALTHFEHKGDEPDAQRERETINRLRRGGSAA